MSKVICAQCGAAIPAVDVNIEKGIALCRSCETITSLADMVESQEGVPTADPDVVPDGCRVDADGISTAFIVNIRSPVTGAFFAFFSLFWNSVTWVFVGIGVLGMLNHFGVQIPGLTPTQSGSGGTPAGSNAPMPLGVSIGIIAFMLPFIAIGIFTMIMTLTSFFGVLRVRFEGTKGSTFAGVGPIGLRKKFDPGRITDIRLVERLVTTHSEHGGSRTRPQRSIEIHAGKKIKIGTTASDERREWLAAAMHRHVFGRR